MIHVCHGAVKTEMNLIPPTLHSLSCILQVNFDQNVAEINVTWLWLQVYLLKNLYNNIINVIWGIIQDNFDQIPTEINVTLAKNST